MLSKYHSASVILNNPVPSLVFPFLLGLSIVVVYPPAFLPVRLQMFNVLNLSLCAKHRTGTRIFVNH